LFIAGAKIFLSSDLISWPRAIILSAAAIGYHIFSVYRQGK
jgi:hypothetical protein